MNDEGKKVKVSGTLGYLLGRCRLDIVQIIRRTKRTLQKSIVDHAVAERAKWAKFGAEKGKQAGPDRATTTIAENVTLKLSAGNKVG